MMKKQLFRRPHVYWFIGTEFMKKKKKKKTRCLSVQCRWIKKCLVLQFESSNLAETFSSKSHVSLSNRCVQTEKKIRLKSIWRKWAVSKEKVKLMPNNRKKKSLPPCKICLRLMINMLILKNKKIPQTSMNCKTFTSPACREVYSRGDVFFFFPCVFIYMCFYILSYVLTAMMSLFNVAHKVIPRLTATTQSVVLWAEEKALELLQTRKKKKKKATYTHSPQNKQTNKKNMHKIRPNIAFYIIPSHSDELFISLDLLFCFCFCRHFMVKFFVVVIFRVCLKLIVQLTSNNSEERNH